MLVEPPPLLAAGYGGRIGGVLRLRLLVRSYPLPAYARRRVHIGSSEARVLDRPIDAMQNLGIAKDADNGDATQQSALQPTARCELTTPVRACKYYRCVTMPEPSGNAVLPAQLKHAPATVAASSVDVQGAGGDARGTYECVVAICREHGFHVFTSLQLAALGHMWLVARRCCLCFRREPAHLRQKCTRWWADVYGLLSMSSKQELFGEFRHIECLNTN
jgi:hypothetical protein